MARLAVDVSEWSGIGSAGPGQATTGNAALSGLTGPSVNLPSATILVIGNAASSNYASTFPPNAPPGSTLFPSDNKPEHLRVPGSAGPFAFTWPSFGNGFDCAASIQSFQPVASSGLAMVGIA